MKQFDLLCEQILKALIKQGGNAVPGVDRIKKQKINATIQKFKKQIIIPVWGRDPGESLFALGSTGKKPDSGDIDLALDATDLTQSILFTLSKFQQACAGKDYVSCINTINFKMLHVAYPQIGQKNKKVQIDLLLTKHPEFTKFYMYSPGPQESKYKGAHRNALLNAISSFLTRKPLSYDKRGKMVKWKEQSLTEDGYYLQYKTLVDENGNNLKYKDTNEDLQEGYAEIIKEQMISINPQEVIIELFGQKFKEKDIDTFQKCFEIVTKDPSFRYKSNAQQILKICAKDLNEKRKRLDFPSELNQYIKK